MKHFLDFAVRRLVDYPDDVQISETVSEPTPSPAGSTAPQRPTRIAYRVGLHPSDIGQVIGKGGRTIGAIRSLIQAASKPGQLYTVEVVENS